MPLQRKNYRAKAAIWLALLAIGFIYLLPHIGTMIGDGGFPLRVQVSSESEREIALWTCDVLSGNEKAKAEEHANYLIQVKGSEHVDRAIRHCESTESECVIDVPTSEKSSYFGYRAKYFQFKWLLIQVDYSDGTEYHQVVELPDGRKSQTLTVPIP
jgi:hypothetical protein